MILCNLMKQPKRNFGLLLFLIVLFTRCEDSEVKIKKSNIQKNDLKFATPTDSVVFNYNSKSWKKSNYEYIENLYGQNIFRDLNNHIIYASINSLNELHTFDFNTNKHHYSKQITKNKIDAFLIENDCINILVDNNLIVKDFKLRTIDSFAFKTPIIKLENGIDFSLENKSNLFKVNNYYVIMYYIVDHNIYRNSKKLFYYFNRDTSFFNNQMCDELEHSFQYFRYPAICSDGGYLIHSPRVLNCISKSNESKTLIHKNISTNNNIYLKINHEDQYEISKLKKYRFRTYYNKELLWDKTNYYLIQEFPSNITYVKNIPTYKHSLKLIKFDSRLKRIKSIVIKDNVYNALLINEGMLYLFNFKKNRYYRYEI